MIVHFKLDNGANIHSCKTVTYDLSKAQDIKAFGYTKEQWLELTEDEKNKQVEEWANNYISYWYEEKP